jgi:hypothetical protein
MLGKINAALLAAVGAVGGFVIYFGGLLDGYIGCGWPSRSEALGCSYSGFLGRLRWWLASWGCGLYFLAFPLGCSTLCD